MEEGKLRHPEEKMLFLSAHQLFGRENDSETGDGHLLTLYPVEIYTPSLEHKEKAKR